MSSSAISGSRGRFSPTVFAGWSTRGILERVAYQERPKRYEYHLTAKGRDLHVALVGLRQWGDEYCSEKPPLLARTKGDKKSVIAALVPKRSDHLRLEEVEFVPGPGRGSR